MAQKVVDLHLEGQQVIPVKAWETGVPGLIVTPGVTTHRTIDGKYCLTHESSGGRVGTNLWDSVEAAQLYAGRVAGLTDWSLGPEALVESFIASSAGSHEAATAWVNEVAEKLQAEIDANPTIVLRRAHAPNS